MFFLGLTSTEALQPQTLSRSLLCHVLGTCCHGTRKILSKNVATGSELGWLTAVAVKVRGLNSPLVPLPLSLTRFRRDVNTVLRWWRPHEEFDPSVTTCNIENLGMKVVFREKMCGKVFMRWIIFSCFVFCDWCLKIHFQSYRIQSWCI